MKREVVEVKALENEAVQDSAPACQGATEGLHKHSKLLDVDPEGGGELLVDERSRSRPSQLGMVEAVDQKPHHQDQPIEDRDHRPPVDDGRTPDVRQAEDPHRPADGLRVLDDRPDDIDEREAYDDDREGGGVSDEQGHDVADDPADQKSQGQREAEGEMIGQDQVRSRVA